jgi:hypothetical protein
VLLIKRRGVCYNTSLDVMNSLEVPIQLINQTNYQTILHCWRAKLIHAALCAALEPRRIIVHRAKSGVDLQILLTGVNVPLV